MIDICTRIMIPFPPFAIVKVISEKLRNKEQTEKPKIKQTSTKLEPFTLNHESQKETKNKNKYPSRNIC